MLKARKVWGVVPVFTVSGGGCGQWGLPGETAVTLAAIPQKEGDEAEGEDGLERTSETESVPEVEAVAVGE